MEINRLIARCKNTHPHRMDEEELILYKSHGTYSLELIKCGHMVRIGSEACGFILETIKARVENDQKSGRIFLLQEDIGDKQLILDVKDDNIGDPYMTGFAFVVESCFSMFIGDSELYNLISKYKDSLEDKHV